LSKPRFRKPNISIKEIPAYIRGGFSYASREIGRLRGTNVWIFIMYGLLFDTVNNLWRPFSAVFLQRLGGNELHIALLNALPGAVGAFVLLPGAMLFRRFTNKKRATAAFILLSRALLLAIAAIPTLPPAVRPLLFVILLAIMNCPDALSQTSLQSLLGTIFEGNTRGQAIALRNKFGQAVVPVVTITTGLIITFVPNTDAQRMILYQIFFVMAFLFGLVEVIMFRRLKVPTAESIAENTPSAISVIPQILKDKKFIKFFLIALLFMFFWQAGWPLIAVHQVMVIQATEMWFAIFALASGTAAFISGSMWQKWLRKYHNNKVFVISAAMLAFNMFLFPLATNVQIMTIVSFFTGFSTIGINAALLNGVLEATPDENRMMYLAFYNTVMSISLFVAPFFSHTLFSLVGNRGAMFVVGGIRVVVVVVIWLVLRYNKSNEMDKKET